MTIIILSDAYYYVVAGIKLGFGDYGFFMVFAAQL
jgi:hypothetical protein